jgi:hypothetical protein
MPGKRKLTMDSIERAVRGAVCPACYQRPPGSETLGNDVPRSCQGQCPIFLNLPKLYRIAVHKDTSTPGALDKQIKDTICPDCTVSPTHGEFCAEFMARTCPLSRFSAEVVILIETLREWQKRPTPSSS